MKTLLASYIEAYGELPASVILFDRTGAMKYCNVHAEKFLHTRICDFNSSLWASHFRTCMENGAHEFQFEEWHRVVKMKVLSKRKDGDQWIVAVLGENGMAADANLEDIHSTRLRELSEMAAGIAHEVNNPLTVIYSRAQILLSALNTGQKVESKDLQEGLKKIIAQAGRVTKIIKGIRSFSRDATEDPMQPTTLKTVLQETLSLANPTIRDFGITIETEGLENDPSVMGRTSELMQVFLILINNAIDAVKDRPFPQVRIVIEVDDRVRVRISDNGDGVSPELEAKIFMPFFTTKPAGSGTGIGLTIASKLIANHGGKIFLNRSFGPSCFEIELPRMGEEVTEVAA